MTRYGSSEDLQAIWYRRQLGHIFDPGWADNYRPTAHRLRQGLRCGLTGLVVIKGEIDALECGQHFQNLWARMCTDQGDGRVAPIQQCQPDG